MTGQGGWPMTASSPGREPFHCGTYYPPTARPGMPSFRQLLDAVHRAWTSGDDEIRAAGAQVVGELASRPARCNHPLWTHRRWPARPPRCS